MKVQISEVARQDIRQIVAYIGQDNRARAVSFGRERHQECRRLGVSPLAFPLVAMVGEPNLRRHSYGNYIIFYRVSDDAGATSVHILRVLHQARDWETLL
jgi:plasmid stabilization system protein ParE